MNAPKLEALFSCAFDYCATEISYPAHMLQLVPKSELADGVEDSITEWLQSESAFWICEGCVSHQLKPESTHDGCTLEEYIKQHGWDKAVKL